MLSPTSEVDLDILVPRKRRRKNERRSMRRRSHGTLRREHGNRQDRNLSRCKHPPGDGDPTLINPTETDEHTDKYDKRQARKKLDNIFHHQVHHRQRRDHHFQNKLRLLQLEQTQRLRRRNDDEANSVAATGLDDQRYAACLLRREAKEAAQARHGVHRPQVRQRSQVRQRQEIEGAQEEAAGPPRQEGEKPRGGEEIEGGGQEAGALSDAVAVQGEEQTITPRPTTEVTR